MFCKLPYSMERCTVKYRLICWIIVFVYCLSVLLLFSNIPDGLTMVTSNNYIVSRNMQKGTNEGLTRTNLSSNEKEGQQVLDRKKTTSGNKQSTYIIGQAKNSVLRLWNHNKENDDILNIHVKDNNQTVGSNRSVSRNTSNNKMPLLQQNTSRKPAVQQIDLDAPGEMGRPVFIDPSRLTIDERLKYKEQWDSNHFNGYVSDMISFHRQLKDVRENECVHINYRTDLPETSVIICFTDESWSALLRTVHSILDRTPSHLLKEIILVDDFSSKDYLKEPLDVYLSSLPRVKVLRASSRLGLIRARMWGAKVAAAPVLFFMDSHCECTVGWLEPILDLIKRNSRHVVQPIIDSVNATTFMYVDFKAKSAQIGGFTWGLVFNWHSIPEYERKIRNYTDHWPIRSPTMAGGLFAISKEYFQYLGGYDQGFDIWGAENLELSFKIWMCGGMLLTAPCSHVGHIFRNRAPYDGTSYDWLKQNNVRLAEVWLDDYKYYYYETINFNLGKYGDVSDRKALRKRLNCSSFQWYLNNIFPGLFVPHRDGVAYGLIQNEAVAICLYRGLPAESLKASKCEPHSKKQYWLMSNIGELRQNNKCLNYNADIKQLALHVCHGKRDGQYWEYNEFDHLRHPKSDTCLELSQDGKLGMTTCAVEIRQRWTLMRGAPPFPSMPNHTSKNNTI